MFPDSSQGPAKIMGVIVENKNQNSVNVMPDSDIQPQTSSLERSNFEQLPINGIMQDVQQTQVMQDEQLKNRGVLHDNSDSTQVVRNYGE